MPCAVAVKLLCEQGLCNTAGLREYQVVSITSTHMAQGTMHGYCRLHPEWSNFDCCMAVLCVCTTGTGMALEDALQLVYAIHEHGPTPEALRQYEDAQRTRVEVLTQISQDNTTAYYVNKDSSRHPLKGASGNREELMKLINSVQFKPVSELAEKTCVS